MTLALAAVVLLDVVLVLALLRRPALVQAPAGRILAFVALFLLPGLVLAQGLSHHLEESKSTQFCLSCHVMEPYGRSLFVDSAEHVPASHFQNRRIDRDEACYTCHTSYAMFGDLRAKWSGVKHVVVNYLGTVPETLSLYRPYNNRECLHCHEGARSFEGNELHTEIRGELETNEASCLECHDLTHEVGGLDDYDVWSERSGS